MTSYQTIRVFIDVSPPRPDGDSYASLLNASLSAAGFTKASDGYYESNFSTSTSFDSKKSQLFSAISSQTVPADTIVTAEISSPKATFFP